MFACDGSDGEHAHGVSGKGVDTIGVDSIGIDSRVFDYDSEHFGLTCGSAWAMSIAKTSSTAGYGEGDYATRSGIAYRNGG